MNIYYYCYFFLYSIYDRLSRDRDFPLFATALYSFLVFALLAFVSHFVSKLFGMRNIFVILPFFFMAATALSIHFFNLWLFLYKGRDKVLYRRYREVRTNTKDIWCFFFLLGSFLSYFYTVLNSR